MDELDYIHELEETMNVLLQKNEELLFSELEQCRKIVSACCTSVTDQNHAQVALKAVLLNSQKEDEVALMDKSCIQEKIKLVQSDFKALETNNEHLMEKLDNLKSLITQQEDDLEILLKTNHAKSQERIKSKHVQNSFTSYQKYFGLEIRPLKNQRIQLIFHNSLSDPTDFTFVIIQLIDKVYYILESEPKLDNLKELEDQLNHTNDLAGFVQLIRMLLTKEAHRLENVDD